MTLKRNLTITFLVLFVSSISVAQENSNSQGLTIRTTPSAALVQLKGDALFTAVTPATIRYPLVGKHDLKISKKGFEDYKTTVDLDPTKAMFLDVTLSRKTRFKATVRSIFIPGWGQKYMDQKHKSTFFALLTVAAAASYLVADHNFDIKFSRFESFRDEFDDAVESGASQQELARRLADLENVQDEAYDAETIRRITVGAVIAAWGLNVLDALFLSPEERGSFSVAGISIEPTSNNNTFGFALRRGF